VNTSVLEPSLSLVERYTGLGAAAGISFLFASALLGTSSGLVAVHQPVQVESARWMAPHQAGQRTEIIPSAENHGRSIPTNANLLEHLRQTTGLTSDQTARLFNVSRRSVHLWLAGGRMSAANEERLLDVVKLVDSFPAETRDQRRHLLLQSGSDGRSALDAYRALSASANTDINRTLELFGAPEINESA